MAHHEISPGQIRGLLLLLILGPLIPTALMVRLMLESMDAARLESREEMERNSQQSLAIVTSSLVRSWETSPPPSRADAPAHISKYLHSYLDPGMLICLVDEKGRVLTGAKPPSGGPVATAALKSPFEGWRIQLYPRRGDSTIRNAVHDQLTFFALPASIAVIANLFIAGLAGFAVHRQMKMQELKNSTLATVSHELKTPLASMRVLLDTLLEGRYRGDDQLREYLQLAASENLRLSRLIDNFLTLSRIERGIHVFRKTSVPPNDVVRSALAATNLKMNGHRIEFRPGENLPPVLADPDSLNMALINLLDNAWKYTGDEKHITVETKQDGRRVLFSVEDNGIGIPPAEQRKIFQRFYQVDRTLSRNTEGSGLGLSIVKYIADAHDGDVFVQSEPGRGSRFTLAIPIA